VVGVQLFQPTAYHLGGLIISGNPQHLAFGGAGIHKQVYDLVDGILIVRAEPEQEVHLQRLIKIILMLLPDAPGIDRVRIVPLSFILISLICLRFWLLQNCAFGSTRIAVWAILYLRFWQSRRKVLDIDKAGPAQTTAFTLDEVDVLQLPEQLDRLVLGATEGFLHFPDGVNDIHSPLLVQPAVLCGQAHAVQQDAVQRPGIGGKLPEAVVLEQCFRDAEVGEQLARLTIEVVQHHLVCPRIFNCMGVLMWKTSFPISAKEKAHLLLKVSHVKIDIAFTAEMMYPYEERHTGCLGFDMGMVKW